MPKLSSFQRQRLTDINARTKWGADSITRSAIKAGIPLNINSKTAEKLLEPRASLTPSFMTGNQAEFQLTAGLKLGENKPELSKVRSMNDGQANHVLF